MGVEANIKVIVKVRTVRNLVTITLGALVSDCVVDFSSSFKNLMTDGYVISVKR